MSPWAFFMQSRELSIVGWNIFLCIVLGLMLSNALYLVMAILQLIEVCLTMILCALVFACLPMFAITSIQCACSVGFVGSGGIFRLLNSIRDFMSGWFWR